MPGPQSLRSSRDRADVRDPVNDVPHIVVAQPVFRHHETQFARIRGFPGIQRALKVAKILLRHGHGFGLVAHGDIHHTVRHLHIHGPDFFRLEDAQAPALDHGRAADADVGPSGRDDDVATGQQHGIARKAPARRDTDDGNQAG